MDSENNITTIHWGGQNFCDIILVTYL